VQGRSAGAPRRICFSGSIEVASRTRSLVRHAVAWFQVPNSFRARTGAVTDDTHPDDFGWPCCLAHSELPAETADTRGDLEGLVSCTSQAYGRLQTFPGCSSCWLAIVMVQTHGCQGREPVARHILPKEVQGRFSPLIFISGLDNVNMPAVCWSVLAVTVTTSTGLIWHADSEEPYIIQVYFTHLRSTDLIRQQAQLRCGSARKVEREQRWVFASCRSSFSSIGLSTGSLDICTWPGRLEVKPGTSRYLTR